MSVPCTSNTNIYISASHIKKLDHPLGEIRLRALENVISKIELGFECNCNAVKKELLTQLFKWFSLEPVVEEGKVLQLILKLIKTDNGSYLNSFGRARLRNEINDLRAKLDYRWQDQLDSLEEVIINPEKFIYNFGKPSTAGPMNSSESYNFNQHCALESLEKSTFTGLSPLDSSVPFELTMNCGDGTLVQKRSDNSVKWLVMPWQILANSDKGILSRLENSLRNSDEISSKVESFQFITNIMFQDFPAEVFLQRPTTVKILLALLESYKMDFNEESENLTVQIIRILYKLTRSLRSRIHYYCDPNIAHKAQKILAKNLENEEYALNHERDGPDGEPFDQNDPFQTAMPNTGNARIIISDLDESELQERQMYIPHYCTETLMIVLRLISIPNESSCFMKIVRNVVDLSWELVELFINSVMPTLWFCNDKTAIRIQEDVKSLFSLLSEILDYFEQFNNIDYFRITYVNVLWIAIKLLSNIVPLELANQVIPKRMKLSMCTAIMDGPIYLMYSALHLTLQEYARRFHGSQEGEMVKLLDETRLVAKSIKEAISVMKISKDRSYSEELNMLYASKLSLLYHKNFRIIRKFISLAQNRAGYKLSAEDKEITTKMTLSLLAHNDQEVQEAVYAECHSAVISALGGDFKSRNIIFLLEANILTEIICHGAMSENQKVKIIAEEILMFLLKGRLEMAESVWMTFIDALIPTLPLLQCLAHPATSLGKSITKLFDPDISCSIKLPFIEVLKSNIRFLFSPITAVRDESLCRLLWLLAQEKNSSQKLPRLTALHGLPLGSLCVFDQQISARRVEGNYQRSCLTSLLDMLRSNHTEPKVKKSALVQVSVMLSDTSLHRTFLDEDGLPLVLEIFSKSLIEKDFVYYPDSVISIITILKHLASSEISVRSELSNRIDVYYNILRSLFLYPNNDSFKMDAAQLLALLVYSRYIMKLTETSVNNPFNISLPHIVMTNMKLPFACNSHWKISINRRTDVSVMHRSNPVASTFIRQLWAWEWNGGEKVLWIKWEDVNDATVDEKLMIRQNELEWLKFTSIHYNIQQKLLDIQNSITHKGVSSAIDFLVMYLKLSNVINAQHFEKILDLQWAETFERFLQSHPTNKEDHNLFLAVLNLLHCFIKTTANGHSEWLCKAVKSMLKSLPDWLSSPDGCEDVHRSLLKLIRMCATIDTKEMEESKNSWINFVTFAISNIFSGEYYDLAFLDWVLYTLTYVIELCEWKNHKDTLASLGHALMELIMSFHTQGTISFMGLTVTRNCIICLNHILNEMQKHLTKNLWMRFWYDENYQSLCWLPSLWRSRDPIVRASALQLLVSLIDGPHTALQLLSAIDMSPGELCHSLLYFVIAREESCIVKEEACLAMANLVRNSHSVAFQYTDTMNPNALLTYIRDNNIYHEIATMLSNCYMLATLDPDLCEDIESAESQCLTSRSNITVSMVPKTIHYLYDCSEDLNKYSARHFDDVIDDESQMQFIATPNLITALCAMLNFLIMIGEHDVIHEIFEHSLHKYIIGCFSDIPKSVSDKKNADHYCNVLEMYTGLCTVLTNCIVNSTDFASIVVFPPEFLRHLLGFLNKDIYFTDIQRMIFLRNRLATEIFKFFVALTLTANQHFDSLQVALESCNVESLVRTICNIIRNSRSELGASAVSFLAFLLSQEMEKNCQEEKATILKDALDSKYVSETENTWDIELQEALSTQNKMRNVIGAASLENRIDENRNECNGTLTIGSDISKVLVNLFVAHNYAKAKKSKQLNDKEVVTVALTNLLCVSKEAKKSAIAENFPATVFMILKEMYVKINSLPIQTFQTYKCQNQEKMHPLLHEIEVIYVMLMNFMYDSNDAKEALAKVGLADIVHKLWTHTSTNKKLLLSTLKLLSTFTAKCSEASQSLILTTVTPGVGLRKTPNSLSLIHVIVQLILKEIDSIGRNNQGQKLHHAFPVLRNAVQNHECRIVLAKSNLMQIFPKIHPAVTKRTKVWQGVEINFLDFLMDFTFFEEGQLSVSKATDSLEVLIQLAQISVGSVRLLAISILRNLSFNAANRPRLLGSTEFLDLILSLLKEGELLDVEIAGSILWALVSNNQKGKVVIRSAGFPACINTVISRISLQQNDENSQEREIIKLLEYVLQIIQPK